MQATALVLNRNFAAIQVTSWQRAISLLFQGHAEVVDHELRTYDFKDWAELSKMMQDHPAGFVHSSTMRIAVPECIRLTRYDRIPRNDVVFTKRNIMEHYKYRCAYCGHKFPSSELNFDHVVPKSRGGLTNWENIVTSCFPCNSKKDDRTPREAGMKMYYLPTKPKHQPVFRRLVLALPLKTRESWQKLIDRCYWDSELQHD